VLTDVSCSRARPAEKPTWVAGVQVLRIEAQLVEKQCIVAFGLTPFMMGQLPGGQQCLFYSFNLEDHVPPQHLLRSIDQCLDLSDLRAYLADFYSPIGRTSIDPELMVRMLVVGYCYGILSKRRS